MRELNKKLVLNLIRESHPLSQVDIFNRTHLSMGTVASIVKELKKSKFVKIGGQGDSGLGRKPTMLRFNTEVQYVLSANFFADEISLALLDLVGNIKARITFPPLLQNGPEAMLNDFISRVLEFLKDHNLEQKLIMGIGMSCEGIVDQVNGVLTYSARLGWRNVHFKEQVEKALGIRTFFDSDGVAMVLGELHTGCGQKAKNLACLDIDAGIGNICIIEGMIYRGAHQMAGEIGHSVLIPDGPQCKCGKRGCLESLASGAAIISRVKKVLSEKGKTDIFHQINSSSTRDAMRVIFEAAQQGEETINQIIQETGYYLGLAVASIINLIDPEVILLTGCVTDEGRGMLLNIIREVAQKHVVDSAFPNTRIEAGVLGANAAVIGAAALVYEFAFRKPVVQV